MTLPAEEIREQLIAITLGLMDSGGIEAVKARPIAKETGISVGTVYNMFGSIDGLIQETNARILESFATEALEKIAPLDEVRTKRLKAGEINDSEALKERLLSFADIYMNFVERFESRWGAMLSYNQGRSVGILSDDYDRQQADLFNFLGKSLVGTNLDTDDSTRRMVARMLWSSVHGIVVLNYVGQASDASRAYTWRQVEVFVSTFVRGVMD